jgi:hypothetical protein
MAGGALRRDRHRRVVPGERWSTASTVPVGTFAAAETQPGGWHHPSIPLRGLKERTMAAVESAFGNPG